MAIEHEDIKYETLLYYCTGTNDIEYVLRARPGTKETESNWQIFKLFYHLGTTNISRIAYANNDSSFSFKASEYSDYKYNRNYETVINPLINLPAGYTFDCATSTFEYAIIGDIPDLTNSENIFNTMNYILVKQGHKTLEKGIEAVWVSATSLKINQSILMNESLVVVS